MLLGSPAEVRKAEVNMGLRQPEYLSRRPFSRLKEALERNETITYP
jgi:hypothetical protein